MTVSRAGCGWCPRNEKAAAGLRSATAILSAHVTTRRSRWRCAGLV